MNPRGFTLIELVVYILVFSVGVTAILSLMPRILASGSNATIRLRGVQVAQAVMEEIMAKKWDETTPNGGGTAVSPSALGPDSLPIVESDISRYDDVDDYDRAGSYSSDTDFGLTPGYGITVNVSYVDVTGTIIDASGVSSYKQIQITVNSTTLGESYGLTAVKGDF
jgi:MSHA pilin protein MshD